MLLRTTTNSNARKGIILIVVLALLTLFAIVGLSFVFYAQSEADASRIFREQSTLRSLDDSPDRLWSFALSKLIYDEFDDTSGIYSGVRGHSLARSMYGFDNYIDANNLFEPNLIPFNGTGRLQSQVTPVGTPNPIPEWQAVNYTAFSQNGQLVDGQMHDPERLNWRPLGNNPGSVTGGINVPYTYPDLNNMFLAAINANGQVLMPSFHRPWLFGSNDPNTNQNWTNAQGKYMTLRPRPVDMSANFPYPEDTGGDVKNLYWLPGPNDSYWIDLNYPVQIGPDGRKFKPLFAFFITDLDNRINLNVHGNVRGVNGAHASNQGWGKWEVNLSNVMLPNVQTPTPNASAPAAEWQNIFTGIPNPGPGAANQVTVRGRYGWDIQPNDRSTYSSGNFSQPGTFPHVYGQVDYDGYQTTLAGPGQVTPVAATQPILLPGQGGYGQYNCFAGFPGGYDNGNTAERTNHPQIFDFFWPFSVPAGSLNPSPNPVPPDNRPAADDRNFPASDMKELLNGGLRVDPTNNSQPANPMKSFLGLILPYNFNDPLDVAGSMRRRSLVTTLSMDIDQPGMIPWMWQNAAGQNANGVTVAPFVQANQVTPPIRPDDPDQISSRAPWGNPSQFPDPATNRNNPLPPNTELSVPGGNANPPTNWRAAIQQIKPFLGRLDLSRPLQQFPNQINAGYTRFDDNTTKIGNLTVYQVYQLAMNDRQNMARDIYALLRRLCGVQQILDPTNPQESDLMPRRWLAQLAVNIVDFIDADDISTPLNYYAAEFPGVTLNATTNPDGYAQSNPNPTIGGTDTPNPPMLLPGATPQPVGETLKYWVFGTELPRVLVNEVFAEYNFAGPAPSTNPVPVKVWAELFCPMPTPNPNGTYEPSDNGNVMLVVPQGATTGPTFAPYRVMLASTCQAAGGPLLPRPSGLGAPLSAWDNDNVLGTPNQTRQGYGTDDPNTPATVAFTGNPGKYFTSVNGQATLTSNNGTIAITPYNPNAPQTSFVVVGPGDNSAGTGFNDVQSSIPNNMPTGTICEPTGAMTYNIAVDANNAWHLGTATGPLISDNQTGITVLLRRLANPRMPPQNNPLQADFNPYVTIDYMSGVQIWNANGPPKGGTYEYSWGKLQPYAADKLLVVPQATTTAPNPLPTPATIHTLGQRNVWGWANGSAAPPAYDWLAHFDRALVSPIDLLHVSFYHPHELTHRFVQPPPGSALPNPPGALPSYWKFKHTGIGPWWDGTIARTGPWFDQTTRLYRLLEFVETYDRAYGINSDGSYGFDGTAFNGQIGVSSVGRRPGRVNINTVWDLEILNALFDPQASNYFTAADIQTIYNNLLATRNPTGGLSQQDRPFIGMAAGHMPYNDPNFGFSVATNAPTNGMGIGDTFLRPNSLLQNTAALDTTNQGHPELPRLFENPRALQNVALPDAILSHPVLRFEPLNKVYNNLTTRSNVFAVWCTVGYFEVVDDTARPVKLGAEIGKANGTNVRHRFFSIVDRTELVIARNLLSAASGAGGNVVSATNPLLGPGQAWVELEMAPGGNQVAQASGNPPTISGQVNANIPGRPNMAWGISAGSVLVVDRGTSTEEWVMVTQVSATQPAGTPAPSANMPVWIQASFIRPHNPGFGVTEPGNPGPQPPIDVRDYQHAPVVPVSVAVN